MFMHPEFSSQFAGERRNEKLMRAQNQRLARQFRGEPGTTQPPARQFRRPLRVVGRLFTAFQA